ncbi:MAG TPA: carbon monoxide dehydrogenase subunit G [Casimicrobiaceae bacterium]|nr:carbon monoxide dehydrogenase subunit G [Casimicrobiaceae bacterium]
MEMNGSRTVPADIDTTWRALNDPEVLKACIPGCESVERVSDNEYRLTMTARVGPVSARFTGRIVLADIVAPTSYTLSFEGQGGAAGFAKGEARVTLSANEPGTRIDYQVKAQIGGKLAQIGSRLVDGAAAKVADDFFARFADRLGGPSPLTVDAGATNISANPVTTESPLRTALRTMSVRLALAAAIIAVMAIYWFTRPA